jgi:hypothetical protein
LLSWLSISSPVCDKTRTKYTLNAPWVLTLSQCSSKYTTNLLVGGFYIGRWRAYLSNLPRFFIPSTLGIWRYLPLSQGQ